MLALGIVLGLGSALAHTGWNTLAKRLAGNHLAGLLAYSVLSLVLLTPVAAVVVVISDASADLAVVGAAVVSGLLHAGYGLMVQLSYRDHDLSAVYPLSRGLAPVLVGLVGLLVFAQRLSVWQWLGVAVIATAILVAARSEVPSAHHARSRGATTWALSIAVAITAYTVWDGWSVLHLHADPILYFWITGLVQCALTLVITRRHVRAVPGVVRAEPTATVLISLLLPLSYVLALIAVRYAPVAVVAAARGTTVVWASIVAVLLLREQMSRVRIAAVVASAAAIGLMAVG